MEVNDFLEDSEPRDNVGESGAVAEGPAAAFLKEDADCDCDAASDVCVSVLAEEKFAIFERLLSGEVNIVDEEGAKEKVVAPLLEAGCTGDLMSGLGGNADSKTGNESPFLTIVDLAVS